LACVLPALESEIGDLTRERKELVADVRMCPDCWVSHEQIFENGNLVAVFGFAGGTISGTKWKTPASWLGAVENGRVKQWRVYADNKPVYDILAKK